MKAYVVDLPVVLRFIGHAGTFECLHLDFLYDIGTIRTVRGARIWLIYAVLFSSSTAEGSSELTIFSSEPPENSDAWS
jgi:hypothetical protein